ncbi:hypothetical protein ACFWXO_05065 [Kitasatospora sp. NPDC059088]|uniref:hypothetical protein n=1 Tax=Kitasatospora sp. NPDC059088 TaxID=3346722 RepID=UPI0036A28FED
MAVTGWPYWGESEQGQALHAAVRVLADSVQYAHCATLPELRQALDRFNAL